MRLAGHVQAKARSFAGACSTQSWQASHKKADRAYGFGRLPLISPIFEADAQKVLLSGFATDLLRS